MRILFVDDDQLVAQSAQMALRDLGHDCDVAGRGATAIELTKRKTYDILVLDIDLPDLSGQQVMKQIEQEGVKAPVLLHSDADDPNLSEDAGNAGAGGFIAKPFSMVDLVSKIEKVLGSSLEAKAKPNPLEPPPPPPRPARRRAPIQRLRSNPAEPEARPKVPELAVPPKPVSDPTPLEPEQSEPEVQPEAPEQVASPDPAEDPAPCEPERLEPEAQPEAPEQVTPPESTEDPAPCEPERLEPDAEPEMPEQIAPPNPAEDPAPFEPEHAQPEPFEPEPLAAPDSPRPVSEEPEQAAAKPRSERRQFALPMAPAEPESTREPAEPSDSPAPAEPPAPALRRSGARRTFGMPNGDEVAPTPVPAEPEPIEVAPKPASPAPEPAEAQAAWDGWNDEGFSASTTTVETAGDRNPVSNSDQEDGASRAGQKTEPVADASSQAAPDKLQMQEGIPDGKDIEPAVIADARNNIPCAILNRWESGAMLLLSEKGLDLPESFTLRPMSSAEQQCLLRWQDADKIGVEFT